MDQRPSSGSDHAGNRSGPVPLRCIDLAFVSNVGGGGRACALTNAELKLPLLNFENVTKLHNAARSPHASNSMIKLATSKTTAPHPNQGNLTDCFLISNIHAKRRRHMQSLARSPCTGVCQQLKTPSLWRLHGKVIPTSSLAMPATGVCVFRVRSVFESRSKNA